jgi:hypothetical protein
MLELGAEPRIEELEQLKVEAVIEESRIILERLKVNLGLVNDQEYLLSEGDLIILTNAIDLLACYLVLANDGITLPGWDCLFCKSFNGEVKELLSICRACGATKPE